MAPEVFKLNSSSLNLKNPGHVIITGGASGIGLATATLLHSHSFKVTILDRSPPPSSSQLTSSTNALFQTADITSWTSQRAAFANAVSKFGAPTAVFVNAGIAEFGDQFFTETLDSDGNLTEPDRRCIDIDIRHVGDTVRLAIFHMRNDKRGLRGGSIVMTASLAGYLASAGAVMYSAAKHGVVGTMRALKQDTAKLGIAVSVIAPGITLTPIVSGRRPDQSVEDWGADMRQLGVPINSPETIALAVAHLIGLGMKANGMGLIIQDNKLADIEGGIARSRKEWMGKEMLDLFRGGRDAPLFPNKL